MLTLYFLYGAIKPNLLETIGLMISDGESKDKRIKFHNGDLENNVANLNPKKRSLSTNSSPSKRNCQLRGQTSLPAKEQPCSRTTSLIQDTPVLLSIRLLNRTFQAIIRDTSNEVSQPGWATLISDYSIVERVRSVFKERELGQHVYFVTGSYEPVSEQSALLNTKEARNRVCPGSYALRLAKELGVNVIKAMDLLDLVESSTEALFTTGSECGGTECTDSEAEQEWDVRTILDEKVSEGQPCFLVDWKPTWVTQSKLGGCRELIDTFRGGRH